jgi:hypothetical protein
MIMAHSEIIFRPRPPVAADYQRLFETTGRRTGNADADDLRPQADHLIRLKRRGAVIRCAFNCRIHFCMGGNGFVEIVWFISLLTAF